MRIIGIDPGYDRLGVAIIEKKDNKEKLLYSDCITTSSKLPLPERIHLIGQEIEVLIKKWLPDLMAIEKLFFTTNQKTVMGVSETKGVIGYIASKAGIKVCEYTPLEVKIATTGYGKATKEQVIFMLSKLLKIDRQEVIKHDDEFDAIAVAMTGLTSNRPSYPQK